MIRFATYKTLSMNSVIVRGGVVSSYISMSYKGFPCFSTLGEARISVLYPLIGNN